MQVDQRRQAQQHRPEHYSERDFGVLGSFTAGDRNAGTPLAIASTPVSAEHPAAKP